MNLATIGLLNYATGAIWLLIALAVFVVLLQTYARTHMSGILWLAGAVVVWPSLARVTSLLLPLFLGRMGLPSTSFLLVTVGISAVEAIGAAILLLIAALVLQRQLKQRFSTENNAAAVSSLPPYQS